MSNQPKTSNVEEGKFPSKGFQINIWFKVDGLKKNQKEISVDGSVSMDEEDIDSDFFKEKMGKYVVWMLKKGIELYKKEKK